jgi:transposase
MSKPCKIIVLTAEQRNELEALLRARSTPQALAERARIVLAFADGKRPQEVAQETGAVLRTVYEWRRRFEVGGPDALHDRARSGRPTTLTPDKVDEVLHATVHNQPHEGTHWSQRLMAKHAGVSKEHVAKIWHAADLRPHRIKSFKISRDPNFVEKVRDVVGLYLNPPDNAIVLSVDEKTQIQALDRTQPMLQLRPGQIERRTHDYKRNGTRSLYAALDTLSGKVIGRVTTRHRAKEFLDFLRKIDRETVKDLDLHVILDNSSTHKTAEVNEWLANHPRFHFHFTPTSASWLNAVEQWFGKFEQRSLYRGVFTSADELTDDIYRHIKAHNEHSAKAFKWTKSADAILASVDRVKALPEVAAMLAGTSKAGH